MLEEMPIGEIFKELEVSHPKWSATVVFGSAKDSHPFLQLGTGDDWYNAYRDEVQPGANGGCMRLDAGSAEESAKELIAMMALWGFHEALEFIKLDGERLANPHPEYAGDGDEEMFDWLKGKMLEVLEEYMQRYPKKGL